MGSVILGQQIQTPQLAVVGDGSVWVASSWGAVLSVSVWWGGELLLLGAEEPLPCRAASPVGVCVRV